MTELRWGQLDAWVWGFGVVALVFGFVVHALWRRAKLEALAADGPYPRQLDMAGPGRRGLRSVLVVVAGGLLVAALMRPQYGTRATELKNLGIDIVVVLDASKSMKVKDVVPDRLTAANLEIHRLVDKLSGGRVALVPFAGLAFLQTPLTNDFEVVKTYLNDLRVEDMPRGGTAIGRALIEAIRALVPAEDLEGTIAEAPGDDAAEDGPRAEFQGSKHKAIVLFTDGEDHEGDPEEAAKLAADRGIKVYTVGVGTNQGRPVPMINERGEYLGTVKGPDGRTPLFSELDMQLLTDIATTTGGSAFHLGPGGLGDALLEAIDKLEKEEYDATYKQLGDDRFQIALIPALVLLLLEAFLGSRARTRRRRRKLASLWLGGLVALLLGGGGCEGMFETEHGAVADGNAALGEGNAEEAAEHYAEAAAEIPESAELSYDRGLAFSAKGEHDEATQQLLRALDTRDRTLRAKVYAGLGAAYARWAMEIERSPALGGSTPSPAPDPGVEPPDEPTPTDPRDAALPKWERAVEHLEQSLLIVADDPEVLRNLEVALLRVDPPCSARNDDLEPNNAPEQAAPIEVEAEQAAAQSGGEQEPPPDAGDELKWTRQLMACPDDVDWLRVDLQPGDRLSAEVTVPEGVGRLALSLYGPDGKTRLMPPPDATDSVTAIEHTAARRAGTYFLEVRNVDHDEVSYGVEVTVRPPCVRTEDHFEENDSAGAAATVAPGPAPGLKLCPGDEDWYALTLAEGESLFVYASLPEGDEDEDEGATNGDPQTELPLHLDVTDGSGRP